MFVCVCGCVYLHACMVVFIQIEAVEENGEGSWIVAWIFGALIGKLVVISNMFSFPTRQIPLGVTF